MKKFVVLFAVLVVAAFILMPGSGNGKYNVSKPLVADGWPLPLPKPPGSGQSMNALIADGYPLPPPIPPKQGSGVASSSTTVIADGYPLPPPIPPGSGSNLAATLYAA